MVKIWALLFFVLSNGSKDNLCFQPFQQFQTTKPIQLIQPIQTIQTNPFQSNLTNPTNPTNVNNLNNVNSSTNSNIFIWSMYLANVWTCSLQVFIIKGIFWKFNFIGHLCDVVQSTCSLYLILCYRAEFGSIRIPGSAWERVSADGHWTARDWGSQNPGH